MKRLLTCMILAPLMVALIGVPVNAQQSSSAYSSEYTSPYSTYTPEHHDPPGELILADVLILRPLGIVASAVGLAGSLVSIPFAASSNSGDLVGRKLIKEPFDYTWCRPLGDVDY